MVFTEMVDDKHDIFVRPKTLKQIFKNKREVLVAESIDDLIELAETRKPDQGLVLHQNIIPQNSSFYSAQNFSKRGPLVELNPEKGCLEARRDACEEYKHEDGPYVAWSWEDSFGVRVYMRPTAIIQGHMIFTKGVNSKFIKDKVELREGGPYHARDSKLNTIKALVPSRSGKDKYQVIVEGLSDLKNLSGNGSWGDIRSIHECPFLKYDFTFRFSGTRTLDPHVVAAILAYSARVGSPSRRIIPQPIPFFQEPVLRLYTTLAYHTAISEVQVDGSVVKTRTRKISYPEIDVMMLHNWFKKGNQQTFFVRGQTQTYATGPPVGERKRMKDYDWSINAPGLPFRGN
jgi:hypothetical protein